MLAHKKSKSLSKAMVVPDPTSGGGSKKTSISPSPSSSNLGGYPYTNNNLKTKKEESPKTPNGRKQPYFGATGSATRNSVAERPLEQSDVLGALIPGMKGSIFSPDSNNVQKARELKKLLNCLEDWGQINDQSMLKLIDSLKENVEALDDKMSALVQKALDSNWCSRSPKVVRAFEDFISELLVIRPCYSGSVLQSLIRKFLPQTPGDLQNPDVISNEDQKVFDATHRNLEKLLNAFPIPRMKESCIKTMGTFYPYMGRPAYTHFCYVKNMIESINYAPQLINQILHLCIHKLCRIDVNVPREHSELLSEIINETILSENVKSENGGVVSISFDNQELINSIILQSNTQINPLVNILDLCLNLVFECIERHVSSLPEDDFDPFYDYLISTFETEVLPTFGVNHVQFLYFYLVSTQPKFTRKFLDFLWKKVININTPAVIRMQCMSYISGVLTRSSVVSVKILKRWLTMMADWANLYVDQRVKSSHWSSVNIQMHGPFYAVCQTIFYVFAFRNKDLVGSKKCTAFTGTLNLGRLVTCDLNPLKAIVQPVAVSFVKVSHIHQISYCQTVLERNQRASIPTTVRESLNVSDIDSIGSFGNILESFFPFDPYYLPRSKKWVEPTYKIYEAYLPEVKIEKSDTERFSDQNEDSVDMELSTSFQDRDCSQYMAKIMSRDIDCMDES